jgi:hypothetical protein
VDELRDYNRIAEVRARLTDEGKIDITAHNVTRLRYLPPPANQTSTPFPPDPAHILINEQGKMIVTNAPPTAVKPSKHPRQCGPIWDVWSEPFIYAVDASLPEKTRDILRESAQTSARSDLMAAPYRFPVKTETELTDAEKANRNIIFFTTSSSQSALRRAIPAPLPDIPSLAADSEEPDLNTLRLMLRPSPWSDNHYVLIVENNTVMPIPLQALGFWQLAYQADWLVYTLQSSKKRPHLNLHAAGCYDHHWQPSVFTTQDFQTDPITR